MSSGRGDRVVYPMSEGFCHVLVPDLECLEDHRDLFLKIQFMCSPSDVLNRQRNGLDVPEYASVNKSLVFHF